MRRSQTSLACTQEESVVKYSPINQFIKGFSPSMAVNSYLNDNVKGEQFFFSFWFFFNGTKFKFRLKVAISSLGMCYALVFPETQAISYLNIVLKHM